jgi:uncharacterized protein YbaR (Trm112 family)
MLQNSLLKILRCPEDRSSLSVASPDIVERVNAAIRQGWIVNRAGKQLERTIDGGLVREDGAYMYPIIDEIPVLLQDDAIAINQIDVTARE